jgi:hypothetical protein
MDDWQDAAFSSRHMHNRVGRSGGRGSGKSKRNSAFDVRKTFGSYSCKCPAWHKLSSGSDRSPDQTASLELYRLTESGQGVVGQLSLPGVLEASVILAASRDSLQRILSELEPVDHGIDAQAAENDDGNDDDAESDQDSDGNDMSEEEPENDRFNTFEKNSFRSPKFWLQWNGVLLPTSTRSSEKPEAGLGYVVFTGNDCRKFKGTLNCASLAWKDVSFSGHRVATRSESDVPVFWGVDRVVSV